MKKYIYEESLKQLLPFSFGVDEQGRYGYIKEGADTVTPFKTLQKVGGINITYQPQTFNLSTYPGLTISDIYLVPSSFIIHDIKDNTTTEGTIPLQTCYITKTFNNGILSVIRTSLPGNIAVDLICDIYIYY